LACNWPIDGYSRYSIAMTFGVHRFDEAGLNALSVESAFMSMANNQA
jgi:hypothetical protein